MKVNNVLLSIIILTSFRNLFIIGLIIDNLKHKIRTFFKILHLKVHDFKFHETLPPCLRFSVRFTRNTPVPMFCIFKDSQSALQRVRFLSILWEAALNITPCVTFGNVCSGQLWVGPLCGASRRTSTNRVNDATRRPRRRPVATLPSGLSHQRNELESGSFLSSCAKAFQQREF